MQQYRCPNCGAAIDYSAKFCSNCGNKLSWVEQPAAEQQYVCPACNCPVATNARFCNNCGSPLSWQTQQQTRIPPEKPLSGKTSTPGTGGNRTLKNTGVIILSLLLFLALVVFGPAFMIDRTMLNPDFVTDEVDSLDITSLLADAVTGLPPEESPGEITDALSATVNKMEPLLQQQLNSGIHSIYDYLRGKKDNPELSKILRSTFLSDEFLYSLIDEVDVAALVKPMLPQFLPMIIPQELTDFSAYIYPAVEDFVDREQVWIKEQMKILVNPVADYLVGDIKSFSVDISLEPLMDSLKGTILQHIESAIAGLGALSPLFTEEFINDVLDQFLQGIPTTYEIRDTMIGAQIPAQIASTIAEIENVLGEAKQYVGYFQIGYIVLILLIVLLIAGIILIYREVKAAARTLGIVFFISGVVDLAAILLLKNMVTEQMKLAIIDLPAQLQIWLLQFINNLASPMLIISICFIAAGVVVIITCLLWKHRASM